MAGSLFEEITRSSAQFFVFLYGVSGTHTCVNTINHKNILCLDVIAGH